MPPRLEIIGASAEEGRRGSISGLTRRLVAWIVPASDQAGRINLCPAQSESQ